MISHKTHTITYLTAHFLMCCILICGFFNFDHLFQSTIISKTICVYLSAILCIFYLFLNHNFLKYDQVSKIDILLLMLLLFGIANNYNDSIWLFDAYSYTFIYLFARFYLSHSKNVMMFFFIYTTINSIQACIGLTQLYDLTNSNHTNFSITGTFHNPGPFAGFIASALPISFGFNLYCKNKFQKIKRNYKLLIYYYISQLNTFILLITIPATHSRAALLGTAIACAYIFYYMKRDLINEYLNRINFNAIKTIIFSVGLIFIVIGILYSINVRSANGRMLMWTVTWEMIKDKPIMGWKSNQFNAQYSNYQAKYFKKHPKSEFSDVAGTPNTPFNELIYITFKYGFIGLIVTVCIISCVFYPIKKRFTYLILARSGLLCIIIFSLFSYAFDTKPIVIQMLFILACFHFHTKIKNVNKYTFKFALLMITGALIFTPKLINHTTNLYQGYKYWYDAEELYNYEIYDQANQYFARADSLLINNGLLLQMHAKCNLLLENNEECLRLCKKAQPFRSSPYLNITMAQAYQNLNQYDQAEQLYKQAINMVPFKMYPLYLLTKLYIQKKDVTNAKYHAKKLLNKKPKINSTAVEEMKNEMKTFLEELP